MPESQLPPDLPPEYAEAYRRGYERAFAQASEPYDGQGTEPSADEPAADAEHTVALPPGGAHRAKPAPVAGPRDRPVWFVPLLLALLVLVLILGAFLLGKVLSNSVEGADVSEDPPTGDLIPSTPLDEPSQDEPTQEESTPEDPPSSDGAGKPYDGPTDVAELSSTEADCQAPDSADAAGNAISYTPANVADGDLTTAWRCNGRGVGQTITLTLPTPTQLGALALVPGYAKTDPSNGVDRYAENNRLTKVRWTFSDGTSVVQDLDGSPTNRDLQSMPIPPTETTEVVLEILASVPGTRNTVAISEIQLGAIPS